MGFLLLLLLNYQEQVGENSSPFHLVRSTFMDSTKEIAGNRSLIAHFTNKGVAMNFKPSKVQNCPCYILFPLGQSSMSPCRTAPDSPQPPVSSYTHPPLQEKSPFESVHTTIVAAILLEEPHRPSCNISSTCTLNYNPLQK